MADVQKRLPSSPPDVVEEPDIDVEKGSLISWEDTTTSIWPMDPHYKKIAQPNDPQRIAEINDMLRRDGFARGIELALTLPLRQSTVAIQKPKEDKGQTEFIEENLLYCPAEGGIQTPMSTIIGQHCQALARRTTFFEKLYTRRNNRIWLKDLSWRPPQSCRIIRDGNTGRLLEFQQLRNWAKPAPRGSQNDEYGRWIPIPANRGYVYIHGVHHDPLNGAGEMDVVYWGYELKEKLKYLWHVYAEMAALPRLAVYGKSPTEAQKRAKKISKLRGSGVVGIDHSFGTESDKVFEVIETAAADKDLYANFIRYIEGEMAMSVLAGWLTLTNSASSPNAGSGGFALSADQTSMFLANRYVDAREMSDALTNEVVAPLVRMNFGPDAKIPRVLIGEMTQEHARQSLEMFTELVGNRPEEIPTGMIDALTERTGEILRLPTDRVHEAIEEQKKAREKREKLAEQMNQPLPTAGDPNRGKVQDTVNAMGKLAKAGPAKPGPTSKRLDPNRSNNRPEVRSVATTKKPNTS